MNARKRDLVGRRIVAVDFGRFATGTNGGRLDGTDPVLILDNGRRVAFSVQEMENGAEYGVCIVISDRTKTEGGAQ